MKRCTKCGRDLPETAEYFYPDKRNGKLRSFCRDCHKQYRDANKTRKAEVDRAYRARNHESIAEGKKRYAEANKEHIAEYHRHYRAKHLHERRDYERAYYHEHKEHKRIYDVQYRAHNKSRIMQRQTRWVKGHIIHVRRKQRAYQTNRHAREMNAQGTHTPADIERQYKAQKGRCYYCGAAVGQKYHVDHVIPLSRGGSNGPENLVISCASCNQSKNSRLPHEWPKGGRLL